jgi:hypothetical protein
MYKVPLALFYDFIAASTSPTLIIRPSPRETAHACRKVLLSQKVRGPEHHHLV